ncbi:MAG: aspartate carbamoyltransferase regulatory subunit [Lachnospiraceae bacterium]|nr:aspartate carbamoyltransferase regulatory subunit [Lachnospiraceae bacterium]
MLNIGGLQDGIVLDHIVCGGAMAIYSYLELDKYDCTVAIIKNAKSKKMGTKDMLKIDGLADINLDVLGVLDPNITIDVIKNGVIIEKRKPLLPKEVTGIIKCQNPRCITSIEQGIKHKFKLVNETTGLYRCVYCEQAFKRRHG